MEERSRAAISHLEGELKIAREASARAEVLASLGRIYEEERHDLEQALYHYRQSLDLEAGCDAAVDGLIRVLGRQRRFRELEQALREAIGQRSERQRLAQLEFQLAELYTDGLEQPQAAMGAFERVLDLDPMNRAVYPALDHLYRQQENWPRVIQNLSAWLDVTQDRKTAIQIWLKMAQVYENELNDPLQARQAMEEVLQLDPENANALRALADHLGRQGLYREQASVLEKQVSLLSFRHPEDQVRIHLELGEIFLHHVNDPALAERYFRRVLDLDPLQSQAREALLKIHEAKANWDEVIAVYRDDLAQIWDPLVKANRLLRIAEILESELGRKEEATGVYREAYAQLTKRGSDSPESRELRSTLSQELVRRYRQEDALDDLKRHYQTMAKDSTTRIEQSFALKNLMELAEGEEAKRYGRELLEIATAFPEKERYDLEILVTKKNIQIALKRAKWREVVGLYERLLAIYAQSLEDRNEQALTHFRMAEILAQKLGDTDRAAFMYARSLELNPHFVPAIKARRELLLKSGQFEEALPLFQAEIAITSGRKAQSALFLQQGIMREENLEETTLAAADYERALELDPQNREAVRRLAVQAYHSQQWAKAEPLFAELEAEILASADPNPLKIATFWLRRGRIAEELGRVSQAITYLNESLKHVPSFVPALEALAHLYEKNLQWQESKEILERLLPLIQEGQAEIFLRLARIEERSHHPLEAKKLYERALMVDAESPEALHALIGIASRAGAWGEVEALMDRLLRETQNPDEWMTLQLAHAEILEQRLHRPDLAIGCYRELLEKDPLNTHVLERLAELLCATGEVKEGVEIWRKLLRGETETKRRISILYALGRTLRLELKDVAGARREFEEILRLEPLHLGALKEMVLILESEAQYVELAKIYERLIEQRTVGDPLLTIPFYLKLGDLYRRHLKEPLKAIAVYRRILEIDEDNVGAANALIDLYTVHESFFEEAIRQHRHFLQSDPLRLASYRALGMIHYKQRQWDRAFCLWSILEVLGEAEPKERDYVARVNSRPTKIQLHPIPEHTRHELLIHSGEHHIVMDVLRTLHEPLHQLFAENTLFERSEEPLGTNRRQILETVEMACRPLRLVIPHVRVFRSSEDQVMAIGGAEPILFVSRGFLSGVYSRLKAFRVVRALETLVHGRDLILRLSVEQLEQCLAVVLKTFFREFAYAKSEKQAFERQVKQLKKLLSKELRYTCEGIVSQMGRLFAEIDLHGCREAVWRTSNRSALLVTGDLESAFKVGLKEEGYDEKEPKRSGLSRLGQVARSARLRDLLTFAGAEAYFTLRERIGRAVSN